MTKTELLSGSILAAGILLLPISAFAQDTATSTADQTTEQAAIPTIGAARGASADEESGEAIVVTGSRIRRSSFDALEPTTVVGSEYLETRGITNIADALNEQPGMGVPQNAAGGQNSYGVSQNFVNKFGLGTARTLTLVNGRRFVSTNAPTVLGNPAGLQVDLNVIPTIMVDRIESVAIGGAPTYGSDAIAGTINVILKKKYVGTEIRVLSGITQEGDNFRLNVAGLTGYDFGPDGRGNIMLAASYDRSEGLRITDRARGRLAQTFQTNPLAGSAQATMPGRTSSNDGRVNTSIPFNTGSSDGIPNLVLINNTRIFDEDVAGLLFPVDMSFDADGTMYGLGPNNEKLHFAPNGDLVPFNPGYPFGNTYGSGGDGFDLTTTRPLLNDLERTSIDMNVSYELTDHIEANFEGEYYHAEGREVIDQPLYNSPLFGGANGALTFSADNPFLSDQASAKLAALGVDQFRLSRDSIDILDHRASSTTDVFRGVAGLTGDFTLFGRDFTFDASANFGRTEGTFFNTDVNQQNFVNSLNVTTDADGNIVCDANPAFNAAPGTVMPVADPNCVPMNVFGLGAPSDAALAYATVRTRATSVLEQQVYNINFGSSNLIDLWSGGVGFNAGYEHRREFGRFTPDPFQAEGLGRGSAIAPNEGSFNTDELFAELLVPLVAPANKVPLINSLVFEGRARYVNNSVNGGFWAYTAGGRYQPFSDIEFRGNFTRSLRAPSIVELFTPQTNAGAFFPDPCDAANLSSGPNPEIRQRNCQAFFDAYGLDAGTFNSIARTSSVPSITGGNPDLDNEVAKSYTFGVVLRPRFVPRFTAAIDWNRIRVKGNIASLSSRNIAEGCYDNPDFDLSNPDAGNSFCTLFTRVQGGTLNGQIVSDPANPGIRTGFVNGDFIEFKGLTAEANYNMSLIALGLDARLYLSGSFFYLDSLSSSNNGVTVNPQQGTIGNPKYSGQFNITYSQWIFDVALQGNYTSSVKYDLLDTVDSRDVLKLGSQWRYNLGITAHVTESADLRLSVTNLFNTYPPFSYVGTNGYDMLGRRFTLSASYKF